MTARPGSLYDASTPRPRPTTPGGSSLGSFAMRSTLLDWHSLRRTPPADATPLGARVQAVVQQERRRQQESEARQRAPQHKQQQQLEVQAKFREIAGMISAVQADVKRQEDLVRRRAAFQRHQELRAICQRAVALGESAQARQAQREAQHEALLAWHTAEERKAARDSAARVQALRSNDYDAYLRLAKRVKNERIQGLLARTAQIMDQMAHRVEQHRLGPAARIMGAGRGRGRAAKPAALSAAAASGTDSAAESAERQRRFFRSIHRVQEPLPAQPQLLVGGELRSYQLEGVRFLTSLYTNQVNGILADEMVSSVIPPLLCPTHSSWHHHAASTGANCRALARRCSASRSSRIWPSPRAARGPI